MPSQSPPKPALRKLTLQRETLRRLTAPELRRAGGGMKSNAWSGSLDPCAPWSRDCWTWNCPSRYPNC